MKSISEWQTAAHGLAVAKGFYDGRAFDDPTWDACRLMKIVAELSEAYECVKRDLPERIGVGGKPEGLSAELADVFLFLADFSESKNINLEECVERKHAYNQTRPRLHGKRL